MSDSVYAAPLIRFPRAELRDLLTGITEAKVIWDNEPIGHVGQRGGRAGYYIELAVVATRTKGIDDVRPVYDPINQVNDVTQVSYRIYTVNIKCVSYNKDIPAFDVIDQIRRGLRSDSAHNEYTNVGIALVDWQDTIDILKDKDNREASVSSFDCMFAWQVSADPEDSNSSGVILGVGSKVAAQPTDVTGITPNVS